MPLQVVLGAQWGDEGKGKIVDILSQEADVVARYQGGANAGHTVIVGDRKVVLHLIPSGILHAGTQCVIGNGTVIDPAALEDELNMLHSQDVDVTGRLFISRQAHLIMPYHKLLDSARENSSESTRIGTTGRGIGPAYADKVNRTGIRMDDLLDRDRFARKVEQNVRHCNALLEAHHPDSPRAKTDEILAAYAAFPHLLEPFLVDTSTLLNDALDAGKRIICEGAQGTLLDIDFGTYPFVTSSNPISGGACTGLGFGPTRVDSILGVIKAYTTRVGEGPFPTEFDSATSEQIRAAGDEYGATTGRPRRCGWFDAVLARYSVRVNGIDSWALTKLDVLDELETVRICTGYKLDGQAIATPPLAAETMARVEPVWEDFPGWRSPTHGIRRIQDLPENARAYLRAIESVTRVPVSILSVGSDRDATIFV